MLRKTQLPIGNAFILTSTQRAAKYNDSHQQTFCRNSNTFLSLWGIWQNLRAIPQNQRMKTALGTSKVLWLVPKNQEDNVVGSVNTWICEAKTGSEPRSGLGTNLFPRLILTSPQSPVARTRELPSRATSRAWGSPGWETTGYSKLTVPTPPPRSWGWASETKSGPPRPGSVGRWGASRGYPSPLPPARPPSSRRPCTRPTRHFRRARPLVKRDRVGAPARCCRGARRGGGAG